MDWTKVLGGLTAAIGGYNQLRQGLGLNDPNRKRKPLKQTTARAGSIEQRVSYIIQMIQKGRREPNVRKTAAQILSRKCGRGKSQRWCVPEKNWRAEVEALFAAVRSNIRYTLDPVDHDLFQSVERTVEFAAGDCDDYVIVLGALLGAVGYPVKCRVVHTKDQPTWNHIYLVVGLPPTGPTEWMPLDASVNKPAGWEVSRRVVKQMRDFDVPTAA